MNILTDVQHLLVLGITPRLVLQNLTVALACGLGIALCYTFVAPRGGNGRSFVAALVVLAMITALVILVIGNNLARAFGLVGAMSIIRFRTAVKDVRDIVFIFFSLAAGMAAGVGFVSVAFTGTALIGLVTVGLSRAQARVQNRRDHLLQFTYTPALGDEAAYLPVLDRHCRHHHLINTRAEEPRGQLELSFYVRLRDPASSDQLVLELSHIPQVHHANLFFDDEYE